MNNLIFLFGEDNYRCYEMYKAIKHKYIDANMGDVNLVELDGTKITIDELDRQTQALPFISNKRLVILRDIFKHKNKDTLDNVLDVLTRTPASTLVLIYESTPPDKRTSLYKKLMKLAIIKDFPLLDGPKLHDWIKRYVANLDGTIEPNAISQLLEWVGPDLWRLSSELSKLHSYNTAITPVTVKDLITPSSNAIVFTLADQLLRKELRPALKTLDMLRSQGENDIYIFALIVSTYRTLILLSLAQKLGLSEKEITSQAKIHPFVVQKSRAALSRTNFTALKKVYRLLVDIDVSLKTGKMESGPGLDYLVAKLAE